MTSSNLLNEERQKPQKRLIEAGLESQRRFDECQRRIGEVLNGSRDTADKSSPEKGYIAAIMGEDGITSLTAGYGRIPIASPNRSYTRAIVYSSDDVLVEVISLVQRLWGRYCDGGHYKATDADFRWLDIRSTREARGEKRRRFRPVGH